MEQVFEVSSLHNCVQLLFPNGWNIWENVFVHVLNKEKRGCVSRIRWKRVFDDGLATGTALGECGHRKERALRDHLQLVCGMAVVGARVGASGQAGLVPVWLMDMMECLIHWHLWDLWARARHRRPFPGWIKNHSRRRTPDWCGLRFQGMFQTTAVIPIPYMLCDKESESDNGKMNECLYIYWVCSSVGRLNPSPRTGYYVFLWERIENVTTQMSVVYFFFIRN